MSRQKEGFQLEERAYPAIDLTNDVSLSNPRLSAPCVQAHQQLPGCAGRQNFNRQRVWGAQKCQFLGSRAQVITFQTKPRASRAHPSPQDPNSVEFRHTTSHRRSTSHALRKSSAPPAWFQPPKQTRTIDITENSHHHVAVPESTAGGTVRQLCQSNPPHRPSILRQPR